MPRPPVPITEYPCPQCGETTRGHGGWEWCAKCTDDFYARKQAALQQQWRDGRRQDRQDYIKSKLREEGPMESQALMATTEQGMMARIERAKFPQALTPEEKRTLAVAALTYGFDPLMGELTIFQGRPFVSIDGRYRKARETGKLDGVRTRPANKQERTDWSIPTEDYFFLAEVFVKGCSMPFQGWGRVKARELTEKSKYHPEKLASPVVADNPQRMAEKRAEVQALRKAFSIPLPSAEDIGVEDVTGLPEVDHATGEVIEAEYRDVTTQPTENAPSTPALPNPPSQDQNVPPAQSCAAERPKEGQPTDVAGLFAEAWKQRGLNQKQVAMLAKKTGPDKITEEDISWLWPEVLKQPKLTAKAGRVGE